MDPIGIEKYLIQKFRLLGWYADHVRNYAFG